MHYYHYLKSGTQLLPLMVHFDFFREIIYLSLVEKNITLFFQKTTKKSAELIIYIFIFKDKYNLFEYLYR